MSTSSYVHVRVYNPDGSALTSSTACYASNGGCDLNLSIATTGVYSVVVTPYNGAQTMSFRATLPTDLPGTLTPNVPQTLALSRRGQNGRLTFAGETGGTVALQVTDQATAPAGERVYYYVYRPDGTLLTSTYTTSTATLTLANLPATGTYTVFADPRYGVASTAQLTLATP